MHGQAAKEDICDRVWRQNKAVVLVKGHMRSLDKLVEVSAGFHPTSGQRRPAAAADGALYLGLFLAFQDGVAWFVIPNLGPPATANGYAEGRN